MVRIAWLGKKSPFCGNVSYGNLITDHLKKRGHNVSFIHFDNHLTTNKSESSFLANDPEVSLPYLIKSQVYTIPSPRAEKIEIAMFENCSRSFPEHVWKFRGGCWPGMG